MEVANKVSLASLILTIIITFGVNLPLTIWNINQVDKANEIANENLKIFNMVSNFTSVIVVDTKSGTLDKGGYYSNGTHGRSDPYGWLNFSLAVMTPHYGLLSIKMENFSAYTNEMVDPQKVNLTTVSPYSQHDEYEYYVVSGLNPLSPTLKLRAALYPNPQKIMPPDGEIEFPIGVLFLKAELLDIQTNQTTTKEFTAIIFVKIRTF